VAEHLLSVVATDTSVVPARVCGLLAQRNIAVSSIQMVKPAGGAYWCIQLVVCLGPEESVELVVKRLNRLVDVVKVVEISGKPHHERKSVFIRLRPATSDLIDLSQLATLFNAEILDLTASGTTLHLSADSARCDEFLAILEPYSVVEIVHGRQPASCWHR
jgi:acetolactate synthase I/III small subunit